MAALAVMVLIAAPHQSVYGGNDEARVIDLAGRQFSFYALSRGRGVPEAARQALAQVRSHFDRLQTAGEVTRIEDVRIGLEGETRVCAEFASVEDATTAWGQVKEIIGEIELVQLKAEPCRGE